MTTFENKCAILADVWINFRYETEYTDFVSYNDLGLPLAYAVDAQIVPATDKAVSFIEETFANLLTAMKYDEDTGYEDFDSMVSNAPE
jgi:hypothetical protein